MGIHVTSNGARPRSRPPVLWALLLGGLLIGAGCQLNFSFSLDGEEAVPEEEEVVGEEEEEEPIQRLTDEEIEADPTWMAHIERLEREFNELPGIKARAELDAFFKRDSRGSVMRPGGVSKSIKSHENGSSAGTETRAGETLFS